MRTAIRATTLVECPFSAFAEMLAAELRETDELVVSPIRGPGERVRLGWSVVDDASDQARRHDAIAFAWTPAHPALLPSFRGTITARPHFRNSWMRISGAYEPPFGTTGGLFDRIAGRALAWMTLRNIARELKAGVEARYRRFVREVTESRGS